MKSLFSCIKIYSKDLKTKPLKGTKHLKIKVQKHEIDDFPTMSLQFSKKWIGLLIDDTCSGDYRHTFRY